MKKKKRPRSIRRKFMLAIATIAFAIMIMFLAIHALAVFLGCLFGDSMHNHHPFTPDGAREYYVPLPWFHGLCPGSFDRR